jgi:hypothetical protein
LRTVNATSVDLQFGPLVGVHRILDRERMQVERRRYGLELGVGGLMQSDPHEAVLDLPGAVQRGVERQLTALAHPALVQRTVHDRR